MIWTNWIPTILLWSIICWIVSVACDWVLGAQHMWGTLKHNVSHVNDTQIQPNAIVNVFICICRQLTSTCPLWGTRHVKCIAGRQQMWTGDLLLNLKNHKTKNKPWISQSNTKWLDISFMISRSLKLPFKTHFRDKILALEKNLKIGKKVAPSPSTMVSIARPEPLQLDRHALASEVLGILQQQRYQRTTAKRNHYASWFENM